MRIETDKIYCGDSLQVLQTLPDNCLDCCVTSPPYYALRDYGTDGQIGREATPEEYVSRITAVFHEVKRVLTPEGTCWLNIADTYCGTGSKADHQDPKYPKGRNGQQVAVNHRAPGCKPKDLIGIPWLVALALRATVGICAVLSFGTRETPCRKARGTDRRAAMNMCFCLPSQRNITMIGKQ